MRKNRLLALVILSFGLAAAANGQPSQVKPISLVSIGLVPSLDIPLGLDSTLYTLGPGGEIAAEMRIADLPLLFVQVNGGYSFAPVQWGTSLSLIDLGAAAGIRFSFLTTLSAYLRAGGGYYYGFLNDQTSQNGMNPFAFGGLGLSWAFIPSLAFELGASYRMFFGLYNDMNFFLGASYQFSGTPPSKPAVKEQPLPEKPKPIELPAPPPVKTLELTDFDIPGIFPVFFKYYNDNPVGKATIRNGENRAVTNLKVSFFMKQYMDNPKPCSAPSRLAVGESAEVAFYGLFRSDMLQISEPTLVSANITMEYTMDGTAQKKEYSQVIRVNDRNAMSWEDARGAAAFVTARDPSVLKFSKNVSGAVMGKASSAMNQKVLAGIAIHEALRLYGLSYVVDPTTPHKEFSKNKKAVDFLQFPQHTLEYKSGDCDDLSILYCALLESVGVETAFITIPGHIYIAICVDLTPDQARSIFYKPDELIFVHEKSWLPLEVTMRDAGFVKAWEEGAKEWLENKRQGQAELYPIHECWERYEAVGISGDAISLSLPSNAQIVRAYTDEVSKLINHELTPRVTTLQAEIKAAKDPRKPMNRLGILYAQYGLMDQAEEQFATLAAKDYVPGLVNMGNLLYMEGDRKGALGYYQRAQLREPKNSNVLLCVARANHDLENYGAAKEAYAMLKEKDPILAERFAFLDMRGEEAARAAEASQTKGILTWEVER